MSMPNQVLITEEGYEGKYVAMRSMSDRTIIASGSNPNIRRHEGVLNCKRAIPVPSRIEAKM